MRIAKYVQGVIRAPLYRLEHWGWDKLVTGLLLFLSALTQQFSGLFTLKYVKCLLFTLTPETSSVPLHPESHKPHSLLTADADQTLFEGNSISESVGWGKERKTWNRNRASLFIINSLKHFPSSFGPLLLCLFWRVPFTCCSAWHGDRDYYFVSFPKSVVFFCALLKRELPS